MYSQEHYEKSAATFSRSYQPIDAIRGMPFSVGCAFKYLARAGFKGDKLEDLKKAHDYLNDVLQFNVFENDNGDRLTEFAVTVEAMQAVYAFAKQNRHIHTLFNTFIEKHEKVYETESFLNEVNIYIRAVDLLECMSAVYEEIAYIEQDRASDGHYE